MTLKEKLENIQELKEILIDLAHTIKVSEDLALAYIKNIKDTPTRQAINAVFSIETYIRAALEEIK